MTSDSDNSIDDADTVAGDDFRPTASLTTLRQRAELLTELRRRFSARGYWEVETPILSRDTVVDAWLEPFTTDAACGAARNRADDSRGGNAELFLQTSPEFGMKRLLACGATAIYQVTRAFRRGEVGQFHNPEFTMVEWYHEGESYHDQMDFVEYLVTGVFQRAAELTATGPDQAPQPIFRGAPRSPFDRLKYDDAFTKLVGAPVLSLSAPQLARLAADHGVSVPATLRPDDCDSWLNLLLAELVEPSLGLDRPTFLYDYPASQAAMATIRTDHPPVAERFELYLGGIELCNGYQELTDPDELEQRMQRQSALRVKAGLRPLPVRSRLLEALRAAGLPICSGVALGFDRLAMLALGKTSLAAVTAFPFGRA